MADEVAKSPNETQDGVPLAAEGNGKSAEDKKSKKKKDKEELDAHVIQVKVYSAYQTYYDGPAKSISAENDTGPFDVLPRHHNFMTLVNAGEVIIRIEGEDDKKLRIERGVMHVRRNKVTLFLDV